MFPIYWNRSKMLVTMLVVSACVHHYQLDIIQFLIVSSKTQLWVCFQTVVPLMLNTNEAKHNNKYPVLAKETQADSFGKGMTCVWWIDKEQNVYTPGCQHQTH